MLKTETGTPQMAARVERAFARLNQGTHEAPRVVFEHGQHWVLCQACGATWGVADATGYGTFDGFAFEELEYGDEGCRDR